jgi:hypothetical protein
MITRIKAFDRDAEGVSPVTRRALLGGTALVILGLFSPGVALAESGPETDEHLFHLFSIALTGHEDLSLATSKRMFDLLRRDGEIGSQRLSALIALADTNRSPEAIKAAAVAAGLDADRMRIVTAWYTGTLDTTDGPVVLAYRDALMYRPVEDGMTVPTYCNKGPMWWTGLPPEITRMPVNTPKVL